jgi:hypothetical protein
MKRFSKDAAALLVLAVACGFASCAFAQRPAAHKKPASGDITGVWMAQPPYMLGKTLKPAPVLTAEIAALLQRRAAAGAKGYVRSVSNMLCHGRAGPAMSLIRSPVEIFQGFGRITMVFENETFNQPRTFYLKEKVQPDNIFPSDNGHSIAHWEGETLVVDTVGLNGRSAFPNDIPASEQARYTERFSVSRDGKVLTDHLVMTDPKSLLKPWIVDLKYDRMPDTEERFQVMCEPDLDALKTLDLEALKDADPEVARLLDPSTRPTDPALKIKPNS